MAAYKRTNDVDQEAQCVAYLALACAELGRTEGAPRVADFTGRFVQAALASDLPPELRRRVEAAAGPG